MHDKVARLPSSELPSSSSSAILPVIDPEGPRALYVPLPLRRAGESSYPICDADCDGAIDGFESSSNASGGSSDC